MHPPTDRRSYMQIDEYRRSSCRSKMPIKIFDEEESLLIELVKLNFLWLKKFLVERLPAVTKDGKKCHFFLSVCLSACLFECPRENSRTNGERGLKRSRSMKGKYWHISDEPGSSQFVWAGSLISQLKVYFPRAKTFGVTSCRKWEPLKFFFRPSMRKVYITRNWPQKASN